jgi:fructose-bisphosphate aldolase class II
MPLIGTAEITTAAARAGHGAAAFNVIQLEHAEAIIAGAEAAQAPVILQISENATRYHGALAPLGYAVLAAARAASVPASVHLDHATGEALVREAIALGFSSVMFDASALGYQENVKATADVVRLCHDSGVWVEAELGEVGGKDGVHAPGARTDSAEAAAYVARCRPRPAGSARFLRGSRRRPGALRPRWVGPFAAKGTTFSTQVSRRLMVTISGGGRLLWRSSSASS